MCLKRLKDPKNMVDFQTRGGTPLQWMSPLFKKITHCRKRKLIFVLRVIIQLSISYNFHFYFPSMCLRHLYCCKGTFGPSYPIFRAVVSIKLNNIKTKWISKVSSLLPFSNNHNVTLSFLMTGSASLSFPSLKLPFFFKKKYPVYMTEGAPY